MISNQSHDGRVTPEDRHFLDTLCFWRAIYAERGPQDSRSEVSVASIITASELRMMSLRILDDRMRRRLVGG